MNSVVDTEMVGSYGVCRKGLTGDAESVFKNTASLR